MTRIMEIYKNEPIIIRSKAPQVFLVLLIISVLMPVIIFNDLVSRDFINGGN